MKKNVALIDTGFDVELYKKLHATEDRCTIKVVRLGKLVSDHAFPDHATYCAAVLSAFMQEEITIFDLGDKNNISGLIYAINLCENNGFTYVSLSIGIEMKYCLLEDANKLYQSIIRLRKTGTIIVAACSNNNCITFPASFPNVIGVRYDKDLLHPIYRESPLDGINIHTSIPNNEIISLIMNQINRDKLTNSLAAPYIVAYLMENGAHIYPHK